MGSEGQRSEKGLDLLRLDGRDPWVRLVCEGCGGMLDPAPTLLSEVMTQAAREQPGRSIYTTKVTTRVLPREMAVPH